MSEIGRNGTRGNESDWCARFPACVFVSFGKGREERKKNETATKGAKKEIAGGGRGEGNTRVSKDVMRERNDEKERKERDAVREKENECELMRVRSEGNERELGRECEDVMRGTKRARAGKREGRERARSAVRDREREVFDPL